MCEFYLEKILLGDLIIPHYIKQDAYHQSLHLNTPYYI